MFKNTRGEVVKTLEVDGRIHGGDSNSNTFAVVTQDPDQLIVGKIDHIIQKIDLDDPPFVVRVSADGQLIAVTLGNFFSGSMASFLLLL